MKILLFGPPGTGKTTWAKELSRKLDLPLFHIDRHFFKGNWEKRPKEEFFRDVDVHMELDQWVIDGNGMRSLEMRYCRAEIAIYYHRPRLLCLWRIFYRIFETWGEPKLDGPDGTQNGVHWKLLEYLWNFDRKYRPMIEKLRERYPKIEFYEVRTDEQRQKLQRKFEAKVDLQK